MLGDMNSVAACMVVSSLFWDSSPHKARALGTDLYPTFRCLERVEIIRNLAQG
jgi:hypothetical protein